MSNLESVRESREGTPFYDVAERAYDTMFALYLTTNPTSSISLSGYSSAFHPTTIEEWKSVNYRVKRELPVLRDMLEAVQSDDVFFNVGAHIGIYSCLVGQKLSDGQVVAFEPYPPNRSRLEHHIHVNRIPGSVQPYALAAAIDGLLADPDARAAMAERGRERARAFSWAGVDEQVTDLYAEVAG